MMVLGVLLLVVGLGQASSRPTRPRLISTQQTNQTVLNRSVCVGHQRMPSPRLMCCGGHPFPRRHFRYKCLGGKPFKRTRTKLSCDKQLYTKRQREKYGCCGKRRYRRLHRICYKDHTYMRLTKVPCPPGLEYKYTLTDKTGRRNFTVCTPCGAGFYSDSFGFSSCKRCISCESYKRKCTPTHGGSCDRGQRSNSEENTSVRTTRGPWKVLGKQQRTEDDLTSTSAVEEIFPTRLILKPSTTHGGNTSAKGICGPGDARNGLELDERDNPPISLGVLCGLVALWASVLVFLSGYLTFKIICKLCGNDHTTGFKRGELDKYLFNKDDKHQLHRTTTETIMLPDSSLRFRNSHQRSVSEPVIITRPFVQKLLSTQKVHSMYDAEWNMYTRQRSRQVEPLLPNNALPQGVKGQNEKQDMALALINVFIDEDVESIRAQNLSLSSECDNSNTNRLNRNNSTQTSSLSIAQGNITGVEWDRFGKFDRRGGVFKKSGSDVVLTVPKNAITGGNVSSILGKVYTSLPQFVPIFNLKDGDRFVAPVVEFSDYPPTRFERHLQLKIPIVSSCESCSSFRVLSIPGNGDMTVEQVPFLDSVSSNQPDMYYQLKGDGFAYVYTKHFTAFTCVCCDRNHLHLDGVVFGQCKRIQNKFEAGVRLYICDRLFLIQDFRKILDESEAKAGRKRMDEKVIRLRNPDLQDEISMQVELTSDVWTTKLRRNGNPVFEPPKTAIEDLTLCPQQTEMPTVAGEWKFISADESIPFGCILDVVHVTRQSPSPCTTFDLQLKTFTMQFEQENQQMVADNLASELTSSDALRFARKLKVPETMLECIKTK